jgi:hypothetical protein
MAFYVGDAIGPVRLAHGDLAQLPLVDAARRYFTEVSGLPLREMPAAMSAYLHALRADNPEAFTLTVKIRSYGIWLAGTALGTLAALAIIRWLATNYKRRRASDQMATIDVMMVVFIVPTAVFLFFISGWIAVACMPASFVGYKLFARWRLRRRNRYTPGRSPNTPARVFGFDRRTQRLLEELGQRWRYFGPDTTNRRSRLCRA